MGEQKRKGKKFKSKDNRRRRLLLFFLSLHRRSFRFKIGAMLLRYARRLVQALASAHWRSRQALHCAGEEERETKERAAAALSFLIKREALSSPISCSSRLGDAIPGSARREERA